MKSAFQKLLKLMIVIFVLFFFANPVAAQSDTPSVATTLPPEQVVFLQELGTRLLWLLVVIGLDLLMGVTDAIKAKAFQWQKLADFLSDYAPKVIGWLSLEALGLLPAELQTLAGLGAALGMGAYAIILISAVGSVLEHVQALGILPANIPGIKQKDNAP